MCETQTEQTITAVVLEQARRIEVGQKAGKNRMVMVRRLFRVPDMLCWSSGSALYVSEECCCQVRE
jgi:hypothetical protein